MGYQIVQGHKKGRTGRLANTLAKGFGGYRAQQLANSEKEEERSKLDKELAQRDRSDASKLYGVLYPHMISKPKKFSPEEQKAFIDNDAERVRENADVWVGKLMRRVENDDGTISYVKMSKQEIQQLTSEQIVALTGADWQKERMLDMAGTSHLNKGVENAKRGYLEVRLPRINQAVTGLEGLMGMVDGDPKQQIADAIKIRDRLITDMNNLQLENSANMYVSLMKRTDMDEIKKEYQDSLNRTNAVLEELGAGSQLKGGGPDGSADSTVPPEQPEFEPEVGMNPFIMKGSPADVARTEGLRGATPQPKPGLLERFVGAAQKNVPFDSKYAGGWEPPAQPQPQPQPQARSADDVLGVPAELRQAQRTSEGAGMGVTELIQGASERHKVDPVLIQAVIDQETGGKWNEDATGGLGEVGLMQLLENGALQHYNDVMQSKRGAPPITPEQAYDPIVNIEIGTWYLRWVSEHLGPGATTGQILQGYNGGSGNVKRGTVSPQAAGYATSVGKRAEGFGGLRR